LPELSPQQPKHPPKLRILKSAENPITYRSKAMAPEMTLEMVRSLQELEAQYMLVSTAFGNLDNDGRFQTSNQREQMAEAVKVAMMNWVRAKNRILGESEDTVNSLRRQVGEAQTAIQDALEGLEDIKATLNVITKVVNVVSTVVATLA
jgi:hypothetical protein